MGLQAVVQCVLGGYPLQPSSAERASKPARTITALLHPSLAATPLLSTWVGPGETLTRSIGLWRPRHVSTSCPPTAARQAATDRLNAPRLSLRCATRRVMRSCPAPPTLSLSARLSCSCEMQGRSKESTHPASVGTSRALTPKRTAWCCALDVDRLSPYRGFGIKAMARITPVGKKSQSALAFSGSFIHCRASASATSPRPAST